MLKHLLLVCVTLLACGTARGFRLPASPLRQKASIRMMAEVDPDVGYDAFGSLTRQGLVPFLIRTVNPDTYDAAVNKYMLQERCSRAEAMGNMDAYFADPNGWAARKMREKSGVIGKTDYVNVNQNAASLVLTSIWAVGAWCAGQSGAPVSLLPITPCPRAVQGSSACSSAFSKCRCWRSKPVLCWTDD